MAAPKSRRPRSGARVGGVGSLDRYWKKRRFDKTPEPRGRPASDGAARSFVIQKHAATRLHYDFRLELDGVLKSWAVPKGPSLDPAEKRLAVHVEDHPVEYGGFEGVIPKGEYGGGPVLLWDRGRWVPEGDPVADYRRGRLSFTLDGEKLHGKWSLVRMQGRDEGGKENWLLLKSDDEAAARGKKGEIVEAKPRSVESGRTIEQVAAAKDRTWHSHRPARGGGAREAVRQAARTAAKTSAPDPSGVEGARRAALPAKVEPQLATLVEHAPPGDGWAHEIKFDGYRILAWVEDGEAVLRTRRGNDWTASFPTAASALAGLPVRAALLDGELVSLDAEGRSSFQDFQARIKDGGESELVYYAFDLVHLDGWDLRRVPLLERKRLLAALLEGGAGAPVVRYSDHVVGQGVELHRKACAMGLEGILSKRAGGPYLAGRGRDWLKVKCARGQEVVIGGFTPPEGARQGIGALLVGVHDAEGRLRYAGKVGTGFDAATLSDLRKRLGKIARKDAPFVDAPSGWRVAGVTWVDPVLVAEVRFAEWTRDGRLRHPSFQGLRGDKPASKVVRERPADESGTSHPGEEEPVEPKAKAKAKDTAKDTKRTRARAPKQGPPRETTRPADRAPAARGKGSAADAPVVAGVTLSNPGRVLYPEDRLTKLDVARYYEAIADRMLPYLEDRPLMLLRCPEGHAAECFYQKHSGMGTPAAVKRVDVPEHKGTSEALVVDSAEALVSLAQMGALEVHVWGSTTRAIERPDQVVMDLDPDPAVPWQRMVEAALLVKERFERFDLEPFVKTTGGKGLHVVVPLRPRAEWDEVKAFTKWVADSMSAEEPERYLAVMTKAKRKGKIFVDYLRNGRGATAVAPYSTRARAGAPVATPIDWDEVGAGVAPAKRPFHLGNVPARAARTDPWKGFEAARRPLTKAALAAAGVRG